MYKITLKGDYTEKDWFTDVFLNGIILTPEKSLTVINHSPIGFAWGYEGSGPSQLALAICIELFGELQARRSYQAFKFKYINKLPTHKSFDTKEIDIGEFIKEHDLILYIKSRYVSPLRGKHSNLIHW